MSAKSTVYLAGPISGKTTGEAIAWREKAATYLNQWGISCSSPMRGKEYFDVEQILEGSYEKHPMSTSRAIMVRDSFDCRSASAILCNLTECGDRISIGTMIELGFAYENKIPVILAMQPGNVHEHPMVLESSYVHVHTLDEALKIAVYLIKPYVSWK